MCCTRCLLSGHGNISCNGCARCRKCTGYHDTDRCVRENHHLFCGPSHRSTSKQCSACLQAVQLQELQHDGAYSLLDIQRKMRGILSGTFRPPKPAPKSHSSSKQETLNLLPYTSLTITHPEPPPLPPPLLLDLHPSRLPSQLLFLILLILLPSPKAQRTRHHHKPHHTGTPQCTTRPFTTVSIVFNK
ncbi:hypothetical protein E2C01_070145 [Portunus trituberculatus]|uniref:Uncharacterized protein n=1 Tax=Portunus trituberculatus TaxID=210409 RepID=A0A5B7HWH6_PORTR|nr:hypothetical protein [Portunus trituberculatus]